MRARGGRRRWLASAVVSMAAVVGACTWPGAASLTPPAGSPAGAPGHGPVAVRCDQGAEGTEQGRAAPTSVGLDPDAVARAVTYASATGAQSIRVYRHDCLVATGAGDPAVEWVPLPAWSMTKGMVSVLVGRAVAMGLLSVDDPIGRHLAIADPAKASITVRHLLTQTSGLRMAWASDLNEAATTDSAAAVLARPFEATPGSTFLYAQTAVTVLVAVVEAAVGADLQDFARRELFGPLGIGDDQWRWDRDGSGRTQGFAFLDMTPRAFARIGSLLLRGGVWEGRRLLDSDYVAAGARGTPANPCYGFLWWTNDGATCANSGFPGPQTFDRRWLPPAPPDAFGLSGLFDQKVIVIPSLDLVVVRMGLPHEVFPDPLGDVAAQQPKWDYRFFRILLSGVTDTPVADPGEWTPDPPPPPVDWLHILELPVSAP